MSNEPESDDPISGISAAETKVAQDGTQKPKRKGRWLIGCALGCGGFIFLILALATLGFVLRGQIASALRAPFAKQYATNCNNARQLGKLTEPADDPFSDVMVSIERPETSLMAAVYACVLLERRLSAADDASREKAVAAITDLRELLYNDPAAGFQDITRIIQKYPELTAGSWYSRLAPPPPPAAPTPAPQR